MTSVGLWGRQDAGLRKTTQQASFTWPMEWR
jgi:hypothetical protein